MMKLSLHTLPEVPLEAEVIAPDHLSGLSETEVAALPVYHGNRKVELGDFFSVSGKLDNYLIEIEGDLSNIKLIGSGTTRGRISISGNVGSHLGAGMSGGEIVVEGDAGDWIGREMSGGRIIINGNAGHMVGSAVRGGAMGMLGGEIIIHGNARNEVGNGMRRGLIAIGGDTEEFTGVNMLAGTIMVLGKLGMRPGAGMKRGTVVSMHEAELLPTFTYDCTYRPNFLRYYFLHLRKLGLAISETSINGSYQRWCGDSIELNKGEILLFTE